MSQIKKLEPRTWHELLEIGRRKRLCQKIGDKKEENTGSQSLFSQHRAYLKNALNFKQHSLILKELLITHHMKQWDGKCVEGMLNYDETKKGCHQRGILSPNMVLIGRWTNNSWIVDRRLLQIKTGSETIRYGTAAMEVLLILRRENCSKFQQRKGREGKKSRSDRLTHPTQNRSNF